MSRSRHRRWVYPIGVEAMDRLGWWADCWSVGAFTSGCVWEFGGHSIRPPHLGLCSIGTAGSPWVDHADELAGRFEDYEPDEGDERSIEEYLLRPAGLSRARSEREIMDAVVAARAAGISWSKIGETLGTSAQAAQQRYGEVVERV